MSSAPVGPKDKIVHHGQGEKSLSTNIPSSANTSKVGTSVLRTDSGAASQVTGKTTKAKFTFKHWWQGVKQWWHEAIAKIRHIKNKNETPSASIKSTELKKSPEHRVLTASGKIEAQFLQAPAASGVLTIDKMDPAAFQKYCENLVKLANSLNQQTLDEGPFRVSAVKNELDKAEKSIRLSDEGEVRKLLESKELYLQSEVLKRCVKEIAGVNLTEDQKKELQKFVAEVYKFVAKVIEDPVTRMQWDTVNMSTNESIGNLFKKFPELNLKTPPNSVRAEALIKELNS